MGRDLLLCLAVVVVGGAPACREPGHSGGGRVVYAWDRPERLDAIAPAGAEVAVYAATVSLQTGAPLWRSRAHPLRLPDGARRIAVIHFEPAPAPLCRPLDDSLRAWLVSRMAEEARRPGVTALQVDYEAPLSERPFLRALIVDLRRALGPNARLSMTALASWCLFDDWLADLPVDEVVPMLYRMGADREPVRRWLDGGKDFRVPLCRRAVAVSLADPPPRLPRGRRTFYFDPRSWTAEDFARTR